MEYKFVDFVKELTTKLDSIHGNRGNVPEDQMWVNQADLTELGEIEKMAGEKLWEVDKGESALSRFFETRLKDGKELERKETEFGYYKIYQFKIEDVNFYLKVNHTDINPQYIISPGTDYLEQYFVFMNARRILLPPKKKLEVVKTKRLYIISGPDNKFWKLPTLYYPTSIKDFLKWMKSEKILKLPKDAELWNREDKNKLIPGILWSVSYHPMRNLKSEDDLTKYNVWVETEYREVIQKEYNEKITEEDIRNGWPGDKADPKLATRIQPIEVNITQETITRFLSEWNERFKVER